MTRFIITVRNKIKKKSGSSSINNTETNNTTNIQ